MMKLKRREFIKAGAGVAAATIFLSTGSRLLGGIFNISLTSGIPMATLNNAMSLPMIGFGTNTLSSEECVRCVADAISVGYRLIDTATIYGNEQFVGEGVKRSGIDRGELFLSSKLWVDDSGYESTKKAFDTSLDKLGTDYLDLYLIHRPRGDVKGTWKAMEELYNQGKIKAIGLSNFSPEQLDELLSYASVKPVINQIENHVFFQQHQSYDYLKRKGIQMQAWSPFAAGRNNIFTNPTLTAIAQKHNVSVAQVSLRWHFQRGVITIPRSRNIDHMKQNLDIFNFALDEEDMTKIAALDLNVTQFPEWE